MAETVLEDVEDMFREQRDNPGKAEERGVDLDVVVARAAIEDDDGDPRDDPLYIHAHDFTWQTHRLLQKTDVMISGGA